MKKGTKTIVIMLSIIMFFIGGVAGVFGLTYFTLPYNEELAPTAEVDVFYSKNADTNTSVASGVGPAEAGAVAVHFLELGNKYTGDCTYIKVGENIDILIDCGSKSNSIATVSSYLNQYITDGTLEYVIVTHAHTDHYAGFATSEKMDSIFDLYDCKNIIYFAQTNQTNGKTYLNFLRELNDEMQNGANVYTAQDVLDGVMTTKDSNGKIASTANLNNGTFTLDAENNITLQVLNSKFYKDSRASSENDYSVCTMLHQGEGAGAKHFLFTGDLEAEGEEFLVQQNTLPQVDLYKAGHHGSKTSSSMTLLNAIQPKRVCVCCCAGSSEYTSAPENQFPTQIFIQNVAKFTTEVYVTTLCVNYKNNEFMSFNGNIVIMSKKTDDEYIISLFCSNNTDKLKDSTWFKEKRLEMCRTELQNGNDISRQWLE